MILKPASRKAIKIACLKFHYAGRIPTAGAVGFSVFNDNNEFCGVVLFGSGATPKMGAQYGLRTGQIMELTRVALNGKQGITTKAVAIAIRLLKKKRPLLKMLVSYADMDQKHNGTIYQAMNWIYVGQTSKGTTFFIDRNGEKRHPRIVGLKSKQYGISREESIKRLGFHPIKTSAKHKYLYPLTPDMVQLVKGMARPYPKNASVV